MIDEIYMIWAAGKSAPTKFYKTLAEVEDGLAYLKTKTPNELLVFKMIGRHPGKRNLLTLTRNPKNCKVGVSLDTKQTELDK